MPQRDPKEEVTYLDVCVCASPLISIQMCTCILRILFADMYAARCQHAVL
jgi:hypothetical protein